MSALLKTQRRAEQMRRNAQFFSRQAVCARPEDVPVLLRAARKCEAGARDAEREARLVA